MVRIGYIDPGSGSLLVQAVVGGVAATGVIARVYWRRLLRFLRLSSPVNDGVEE